MFTAKQLRRIEHRARMAERREWQRSAAGVRPVRILANVGRNHPDYGMTPQQHFLAKQERLGA